jgi:membrane protease YdiL (CAAX protease family)
MLYMRLIKYNKLHLVDVALLSVNCIVFVLLVRLLPFLVKSIFGTSWIVCAIIPVSILATTILFCRLLYRVTLVKPLSRCKGQPVAQAAKGCLYGAALCIGAALLSLAVGGGSFGTGSRNNPVLLLRAAVAIVLLAASEETFFRGFLYQYLKFKAGRVWSIAISSGLFCLAHAHLCMNLEDSIFLANMFLFGLILAVERMQSDSLSRCIGAHAAWNLMLLMLQSGNDGFFSLQLSNNVWGGYMKGIEWALGTTLMISVSLALTELFRRWRRLGQQCHNNLSRRNTAATV